VATGYWHPRLGTGEAGAAELRPWLVQLEHGWGRLRPLWARALTRHLPRQRPAPTSRTSAAATSRAAIAPPVATRGAADLALEPEAHAGIVEAGLLGAIEFRVDGVALPAPAGQRGLSVLRYLLARPSHACSRDELLAEFWPEVAPEVARNRLQVAVSALRRALAEITRLPVIEYAAGGYRLNPELLVAVDVERFEEALASARAAERAGDAEAALVAYAKAVELYRGDFAADAPYEQWALLARETMRLAYLDALDRVSRLQLDLGRLDDAIATALRMLGVDPCREDAHRLLMGCYAAQGRASQALRQFDYCRRVLRATIDAEPEPATTRLARAIREGSVPEPSLIG
jgi:DNA-binding SARP family transcriptional activator